jgi:hypothetical protein
VCTHVYRVLVSFFLSFFEIRYQASLELTIWSSCVSLLNVGIIVAYRQAQLWVFYIKIMSSVNRHNFISTFPVWISYIFFFIGYLLWLELPILCCRE